jgi:NAD(P)H-dependent FMN reductase
MSVERLRLAVIVGSIRQGRFGPTVANWFVEEARKQDQFDIDVIDLADVKLPVSLGTPDAEGGQALGRMMPVMEGADAFVLVTPEYNHSYPAALKNAIDWHFTQWQAKPVGFVSYGGISGGLRAVEHLRQVLAELHAVAIRDTVSLAGAQYAFDDNGQLRDPKDPTAAVKVMLDQLAWWALALREAKVKRPFQVA